MTENSVICKDYLSLVNSRQCMYYEPVEPKIGLCKCSMKLAFLCHYSEQFLGIYRGDAGFTSYEELKEEKYGKNNS